MQFKVTLYVNKSLGGITVEGNTVQCLRRTDERTATGRRRQRVICTIDRWASELSAEARELLTEEEQAEWAAWKVKHDAEYRKKQLGIALDAVTKTMEAATTALRECVAKPADPTAMWAAIEALSAELEKAGHEKPKRPRGRPRTNDDDDDQLIEHWPMGTHPPLPNFAPPGTEAHRQYQSLLDSFEAYRRANEDS